MTEDRFKEILEELFDSKIEIIQMIDTIDKKLEKLILARNFFQTEHSIGMTVPQDYDPLQTPVKKESTKKGAGPQDQKIITERKKGEKTRRKVVKISSTLCKKCQGHISWDDYETTGRPIHVDMNGFVMGNGDCPKWEDNYE